jgi:hypothetical protein
VGSILATEQSQKIARARTAELRFLGRAFSRELMGHFSPGPQYSVPGMCGGAPSNRFEAEKRLQNQHCRMTTGETLAGSQRVSLSATVSTQAHSQAAGLVSPSPTRDGPQDEHCCRMRV